MTAEYIIKQITELLLITLGILFTSIMAFPALPPLVQAGTERSNKCWSSQSKYDKKIIN